MFRTILVLISAVIFFLPVSLIAQLIILIVGIFNRKKRDLMALHFIQGAIKYALFIVGVKLTVKGEENIPKDEPVLYISNHRGIFDVLCMITMFPGPTGFVAKKEFDHLFTLTWWMKLLYCELLDRGNLKKGMRSMVHCADLVKSGISVAICPEGTRNKTDEPMLEFHQGSFIIADRSNCRIVPAVLNNTAEVFEKHIPFFKAQHVILEFLPPVDVAPLDRKQRRDLPEQLRSRMIEVYLNNQALI